MAASKKTANGNGAADARRAKAEGAADHRPTGVADTVPVAGGERMRAVRGVIEQGLARRRNAMAIWQELVDRHGFAGG
jgi:hypothetical protein